MTTARGKQAIGTVCVKEQVWAYNPKTHAIELQPIVHVWLNHDNDLVDLTLTIQSHAPHSILTTRKSEVVHTNKKYPFSTVEQGFLPVGQGGDARRMCQWLCGRYDRMAACFRDPDDVQSGSHAGPHLHGGRWIVHNCGWDGDSNPYGDRTLVSKLTRVSTGYLKQKGIDARDVKDGLELGNGAYFDLCKDRDGNLFTVRKNEGSAATAQNVGININDLLGE